MVAHSRVIPYVRIYILREVDTARRIHAERGSSQFRRYSSTRYLTPPDRHVSRTRRSRTPFATPRNDAAPRGRRGRFALSNAGAQEQDQERGEDGTQGREKVNAHRALAAGVGSWPRGYAAGDHCFSALGAGAYSLRRGGALRGGRPRCAPDVPQMTQRSLCALGPRLPLARHRLGDHAESPPSKTT